MQEQDAGTLAGSSAITCDVCIVGSGAAAISLAHRLIGSKLDVVMLESSSPDRTFRQPCAGSQLALVQREMTDRERSSCHRYLDKPAQNLYDGVVSQGVRDFDETFLTRSRVRVYGGTTNCWGGWTRTMDPIDFTRTQLGGPWPFTRQDLEPWYQEAQWLCSLGDPGKPEFPLSVYDDASWLVGKTTRPVKPMQFTAQSKVRTGVLSVLSRNGVIDNGLDFQLLWGPELQSAPNVRIYYNANVRYIENGSGIATRLVGQTLTSSGTRGPEFYVQSKIYVLAAGGVETVRLMQLSRVPDPSGKLGKGFMIHPLNDWPAPGGVFLPTRNVPQEVINLYAGGFHLSNPSPRYNPSFNGVLMPTEAMMNSNVGNFRAMVSFSGGTVNVNWEQMPDDTNEIRLSTQRDIFGDPVVDLRWSIKQSDWVTLRAAVNVVGEELTLLGYATQYRYAVDESNPNFLMGDHPMGATRMGTSPSTAVVDKNSTVFGTNNLFIASSSVFPQTGWSNPTLTIVALARRLAGHISGLLK